MNYGYIKNLKYYKYVVYCKNNYFECIHVALSGEATMNFGGVKLRIEPPAKFQGGPKDNYEDFEKRLRTWA